MRTRALRIGALALMIVACTEKDSGVLSPLQPQRSMAGETISRLVPDSLRALGNTAVPKRKFVVLDASNNPIAGVRGTITVTQGGGTVSKTTYMTAADGTVSFAWTLGASGPQAVTVTLNGSSATTVFHAYAVSPSSHLEVVAGNGQHAPPGQALPQTLRARFVMPDGTPVDNYAVKWAVKTGEGTIVNRTGVTDANGEVTNTWTLGWASVSQQVQVAVEGLDSVVFNATADTAKITFQYRFPAVVAQPDSTYNVTIEVYDSLGAPMVGAKGTWSVVSGAGTLSSTRISTNGLGRNSTNWHFGPYSSDEQRLRATIGALGSRDIVFAFVLTTSCAAPASEVTGIEYAITDSYYRVLPNFTDQGKAARIQSYLACVYEFMRANDNANAGKYVTAARQQMTQPYDFYADPADAGVVLRLLDELSLILGL